MKIFATTGFIEIFLDRRPCQDVKGDDSVEPKVLVLPSQQKHPEDGDRVSS